MDNSALGTAAAYSALCINSNSLEFSMKQIKRMCQERLY